jgi:hypothetical protein
MCCVTAPAVSCDFKSVSQLYESLFFNKNRVSFIERLGQEYSKPANVYEEFDNSRRNESYKDRGKL